MDKFLINGGTPLNGTICVSGSKNATLPIAVAAAILADSRSVLENVPDLMDVQTLRLVLKELRAKTHFESGRLTIDPIDGKAYEAPYNLVRKMRASVYVLGPLVAKLGRAKVSFPGGCAIGQRPVDLHLKGLEALGAKIELESGYIYATANRLIGTEIDLKGPRGSSVGATINVMMAATLAEGTTIIRGAACEPEISDVANFLNKMGAKIDGDGTTKITICGVNSLKGTQHKVISDRIETGTFMIASAITNGDLFIENAVEDHLTAVSEKLIEIGVSLDFSDHGVRVSVPDRLSPIDVRTGVYPGFPTDMQAQIMGLLAIVRGTSAIAETIFEDRFMHVSELNRMGAQIRVDGNNAIVDGVDFLSAAPVMASDLRAGAVMILAGLVARGETIVSRVYHIDRGYEKIERKLSSIGADIRRISN